MNTERMMLGPNKDKAKPQHENGARAQVSPEIQQIVNDKLKPRLKPEVIERLEKEALTGVVGKAITDLADQDKLQMTTEQQEALTRLIVDDLKGIGPLQQLIDQKNITDIQVNGHKNIYIELNGLMQLTDVRFRDEEHLRSIAQRIARQIGRRVDDTNPICDARLADGSRVCIVIPPIAIDGTNISIRKFPDQQITLNDLVSRGSMNAPMRDFLQLAGKARLNILISGGTSSGKTTLLNALSQFIAPNEAVITIEDSAELRLLQPNVRRWECRPAQVDGVREIGQRELVKTALRARPDRIIVGEVRGAEALEMLSAFNTGHDGSMSTLHANNCRDAIARLVTMVLMGGSELPVANIKQNIASSVDLILQVERSPDGVRRVTEISEVVGMEGDVVTMQPLFVFKVDDVKDKKIEGRHMTMPASLKTSEKFMRFGLLESAKNIFAKA